MNDRRKTSSAPSASERRFVTFVSILILSIALGACTDRPDAEGLESDTLTMDPDAGTDTSAFAGGASDADTVEVGLRAFTIDMPSSLEPGPTVFRVTNAGEIAHNFEVEGQGIEEVFETNLQPGDTNTLRMDLEEGTYTVYCPVGDHQAEGMELELTVSGGTPIVPTY